MARPRNTARPATVGVAIAAPTLRRSVVDVLARSGRYEAFPFQRSDIAAGSWPRRTYAAIVATPGAFRASLSRRVRRRAGAPVILVVRENALVREKEALAAADAFVLAERLETLPSIVVLSAYRLSIMPGSGRGRAREKK